MTKDVSTDQLAAALTAPDAGDALGALALPETVADLRRVMAAMSELANADPPEVGATVHERVPMDDGLTGMVVAPSGKGPFPVLCFLHGGGWVCGSPGDYRKLLLRFAEQGILCIAPDYRLAPEHPFPAPFEDCVSAFRWTARECGHLGGDPGRVGIGGDSAGGNFAAAVAAALAGEADAPRAAALIYGAFDFALLDGVRGPTDGLVARGNDISARAYLGDDRERLLDDPRVSPIHVADRLPPCHVVVGGADALTRQADALVARLEASGVPHEHFVDAGMPHGYFQLEVLPAARPAIKRLCAFLHRTL